MKESSLKKSILLRMVLVAVLVMFLFIPIMLVQFLVSDRKMNHDEAVREVTEKWGGSQVLTGPVLSIPVRKAVRKQGAVTGTRIETYHILPEDLEVSGVVTPEVRSRGIHRVVLYTIQLKLHSKFHTDPVLLYAGEKHEILWNDASLAVGISDPKGIRRIIHIRVDGKNASPDPGIEPSGPVSSGFTIRIPHADRSQKIDLSMELDLKGCEDFKIVPVGKKTRLELRGPWGDPSFMGGFLPEKRDIRDESFVAAWQIHDYNRNIRHSWVGTEQDVAAHAFGVRLILPVDEYQKNTRAAKYAIMFIVLTFLAFFMMDVMKKTPFHPVHYTLVSLALVLFFVLLLSLSEYLSFNIAYIVSAVAVVLLNCMYTRGFTGQWGMTVIIGSLLTILYAFLFVLLQLEDYALLIGSLGLLVILALVMYLTRKIDWFGLSSAD